MYTKDEQKELLTLIFLTVQKVFSVYNYKLCNDCEAQEFNYKCTIRDKNEDEEYKKDSYILNENKLVGYFCLKNSVCEFEVLINRAKNCFRDLIFIIKNCIRTLKSIYQSFCIEAINKAGVAHIIEETIQNSIISIIIGEKHLNSFEFPLVEQFCELLERLSKWANRTYEGRKIPFSFLVDLNRAKKDAKIFQGLTDFLKDDASALITDGISSYISIAAKLEYKVVEYFDAEGDVNDDFPLVPYRFSSFGNMCIGKNKIGIILTVQGDILFIKGKKLVFAKRNGEWHRYDYEAFHETLFGDMPELHRVNQTIVPYEMENKNLSKSLLIDYRMKVKKIYLTCLDVAFARTGGCFAICLDENIKKIKKDINSFDLHRPFKHRKKGAKIDSKRYILEDIIVNKKTFDLLGRKARQELLGVDGATVMSTDWKFITTGAIIDNKITKSDEDLHGGARTKIAKKLSNYGVAIKISADGCIECYKDMKNIF